MVMRYIEELDDPWVTATDRAAQAGKLLARVLLAEHRRNVQGSSAGRCYLCGLRNFWFIVLYLRRVLSSLNCLYFCSIYHFLCWRTNYDQILIVYYIYSHNLSYTLQLQPTLPSPQLLLRRVSRAGLSLSWVMAWVLV